SGEGPPGGGGSATGRGRASGSVSLRHPEVSQRSERQSRLGLPGRAAVARGGLLLMAEQLMIRCDNPTCESVGLPEHVPGQYGERPKKNERVMAPYGCHQGDGWLVGSGPGYSYM